MKTLNEKLNAINSVECQTEGPAVTFQGELLRAVQELTYAFTKNGDKFFKRSGSEAAASAMSYIVLNTDKMSNDARFKILDLNLNRTGLYTSDEAYDAMLVELTTILVNYYEESALNNELKELMFFENFNNSLDLWS